MQDIKDGIRGVAPVRERGLKCYAVHRIGTQACRSREGAWIEIRPDTAPDNRACGRSREGAWIEI